MWNAGHAEQQAQQQAQQAQLQAQLQAQQMSLQQTQMAQQAQKDQEELEKAKTAAASLNTPVKPAAAKSPVSGFPYKSPPPPKSTVHQASMFHAAPKAEGSKTVPVQTKPGPSKPVPGSAGRVGKEKDQSEDKVIDVDQDQQPKDKDQWKEKKEWKGKDQWKDWKQSDWKPSQSSQPSQPPQPKHAAVPPARSEDVKKALTPVWKAIDMIKSTSQSAIDQLWTQCDANNQDLRDLLQKQSEINEDMRVQVHDIDTKIRSGMDAVQELRNSNMLTMDEIKLSDSVIKQIKADIVSDKADVTLKLSETNARVKTACESINNHADILDVHRKWATENNDSLRQSLEADRLKIAGLENMVMSLGADLGSTKAKLKELMEEKVTSESSSAKRQKKA